MLAKVSTNVGSERIIGGAVEDTSRVRQCESAIGIHPMAGQPLPNGRRRGIADTRRDRGRVPQTESLLLAAVRAG